MSSCADVHSILYKGVDPLKKELIPLSNSKVHVTRYWPGKAPEYTSGKTDHDDDDDEIFATQKKLTDEEQQIENLRAEIQLRHAIVTSSRLHRLAKSQTKRTPEEQHILAKERRHIYEGEVIKSGDYKTETDDEKSITKTKKEKDSDASKGGGVFSKAKSLIKKEKEDVEFGKKKINNGEDNFMEESDDENNVDNTKIQEKKRRNNDKKSVKTEQEDDYGESSEINNKPLSSSFYNKKIYVEIDEESRETQKMKILEQRKKEELLLETKQSQIHLDYDDDNSTDFNSDDDDDDFDDLNSHMQKPIFVPKKDRETIKEQERLEKLKEEEETKKREKEIERKKETKELLINILKKEDEEFQLQIQNAVKREDEIVDEEMPDDKDGVNPAQEYELWKEREISRIQRDHEEITTREKFLSAIERRRNMTEEERREDDKTLDAMAPKKEKKHKYLFMQKYYHKGSFFQDKANNAEEPIYLRDFNAPVNEDLHDKKILPQAMRLRRGQFGKAGQTKHTHLLDIDTTDFTAPWVKTASDLYAQKLNKFSEDFERPVYKKKKAAP